MLQRVSPLAAAFACALLAQFVLSSCASMRDRALGSFDVHEFADSGGPGPRVLAVTAHPDDEIAFAGVLYKTATHLGGTCDLAVITDGDAGFKYSTLAQRIYRADLTDPAVGRARLPTIRRRELIACGDVLGLHAIVFLHQRDPRYTKDPAEVLDAGDAGWDLRFVRGALRALLLTGKYDYVLTHLPVPDTHGHHKAATLLALQAVAALPPRDRPAVLGSFHSVKDAPTPEVPDELAGFPITRIRRDVGPFTFDRSQKFGFRDQLDYHIVVNWAIAAHRSQGTMQKLMGRADVEGFFLYALEAPAVGPDHVTAWFARLAEPQFTTRDYVD